MSDSPNNQNLGKDFLLLWGDNPDLTLRVGKSSSSFLPALATPGSGGGGGGTGGGGGGTGGGGGGGGGPVVVDMLLDNWLLLAQPNRTNSFMKGSGTRSYALLDTDPAWPVGFPTSGVFIWSKDPTGAAKDIERYDALGTSNPKIYHWATEYASAPGSPPPPYASWFLDPFAFKLQIVPVPFLPRLFTLGTTVTIDSPSPNASERHTDCGTFTSGNLGDIRCVTTGPFMYTWGGSIDIGAGPDVNGPVIDNANGVPTIRNDYMFSGSIASGVFTVRESTFFVQGFGRIAWILYHLIGGVWVEQQRTVNNVLTAGTAVPDFPCGAGQPWWV